MLAGTASELSSGSSSSTSSGSDGGTHSSLATIQLKNCSNVKEFTFSSFSENSVTSVMKILASCARRSAFSVGRNYPLISPAPQSYTAPLYFTAPRAFADRSAILRFRWAHLVVDLDAHQPEEVVNLGIVHILVAILVNTAEQLLDILFGFPQKFKPQDAPARLHLLVVLVQQPLIGHMVVAL